MINKLVWKKIRWYATYIFLALLISLIVYYFAHIEIPNDSPVPPIVIAVLVRIELFMIVALSFTIGAALWSKFSSIKKEVDNLEKQLKEDEKEQDPE